MHPTLRTHQCIVAVERLIHSFDEGLLIVDRRSPLPDELNFSPGSTTDPGCGPSGNSTPVFFIVKGNYRVTDAG